MTNYLTAEYEQIERSLQPFIDESQLDSVTVSSLIRGCVEVIEPEPTRASVTIISEQDLSSGVSVRMRHIKVGLKFALDSICAFNSFIDATGIKLIIAVLRTIDFLQRNIVVRFEKQEAIVLFCIYRLRAATPHKIIEYSVETTSDGSRLSLEEVNSALHKLEEVAAVELENGKYILSDTIIVRK